MSTEYFSFIKEGERIPFLNKNAHLRAQTIHKPLSFSVIFSSLKYLLVKDFKAYFQKGSNPRILPTVVSPRSYNLALQHKPLLKSNVWVWSMKLIVEEQMQGCL